MPVARYPIRRDMMFLDATNFNVYYAGAVAVKLNSKLIILSQFHGVVQTTLVIFGVCASNAIEANTLKLNK